MQVLSLLSEFTCLSVAKQVDSGYGNHSHGGILEKLSHFEPSQCTITWLSLNHFSVMDEVISSPDEKRYLIRKEEKTRN